MEPFDRDELSDPELDRLLAAWKAPSAPARLRSALFPGGSGNWWQRAWHASFRVPLPVAVAIAIALALAVWRWPGSPVHTGRATELRPVMELKPIILRRTE